MHAATLHEIQVIRESLSLEDVAIGGDADGALYRVEAGGHLHIRRGHISRTGGWGSLIHVKGGTLILEDVTLSGAQEHYLLPEPRPPIADDYLHGAVLVTESGQADLRRVQASGRAPALRLSVGTAEATACTFSGTETAVLDVQADSRATLTGCRLEGRLYGLSSRIVLNRCGIAGASTHFGAHLELHDCDVQDTLCPEDGTLTVQGGTGRASGTVIFARGTASVRLRDFTITEAGGRGIELQGAARCHVEGGTISGTVGDGIAAFDAATLAITGTSIAGVGGVPIRLAGASDGPEGAEAEEFAHPGGPGGDAAALLRLRLDAISADARPLLVQRLADRADPTLSRWAESCRIMGAAALAVRDQGPVATVKGAIIGLVAAESGLWLLTARQVHRRTDGTLKAWPLPVSGELIEADGLGCIVAGDQGLFNPDVGKHWPLPRSGALLSLRLAGNRVHLQGCDTDGHPTDRSTWTVRVDRTTGQASDVELVCQGGGAGPGVVKAVQTPAGEARIWGQTLRWQERNVLLPGGINTLAVDGESLLVGTCEGEVYRLT